MPNLSDLRKHADLTDEERHALDFQVIAGDHTRAAVASLLTAILCERVEGFHGEPGDWLEAGRALLLALLRSAKMDNLISLQKERDGQVLVMSTYRPDKLLLLWGATREAIEGRRRIRAAQRFDQQQQSAAAA